MRVKVNDCNHLKMEDRDTLLVERNVDAAGENLERKATITAKTLLPAALIMII
jgi:hypothetical protein